MNSRNEVLIMTRKQIIVFTMEFIVYLRIAVQEIFVQKRTAAALVEIVVEMKCVLTSYV